MNNRKVGEEKNRNTKLFDLVLDYHFNQQKCVANTRFSCVFWKMWVVFNFFLFSSRGTPLFEAPRATALVALPTRRIRHFSGSMSMQKSICIKCNIAIRRDTLHFNSCHILIETTHNVQNIYTINIYSCLFMPNNFTHGLHILPSHIHPPKKTTNHKN